AFYTRPMVAAAVIIHLVTDGTWLEMDLDQKQESIFVQLVDTKNQSHDLGENAGLVITQPKLDRQKSAAGEHGLSCRKNPLIIPVVHDLSQHFYHTQAILITFRSQYVAISGVALRSFQDFDPIAVSSCQSGQTYSSAEQR
ncbi:hypothetical protein Chor_004553, partial [Crotalus horridus]